MNRSLVVLGIILTRTGMTDAPRAQTETVQEPSQFRFQLEQTDSHRGAAVQGYVYNGLPWRITNVRLRVDSIDSNGTVTASASGWVQGDVKAGDRAYFYVPIRASAAAYRASVQTFDKVAAEALPSQAP